jgi:hypothetical protein
MERAISDTSRWSSKIIFQNAKEFICSSVCLWNESQRNDDLVITFHMTDGLESREKTLIGIDVTVSFDGVPIMSIAFGSENSTFRKDTNGLWFIEERTDDFKCFIRIYKVQESDSKIYKMTLTMNVSDLEMLLTKHI